MSAELLDESIEKLTWHSADGNVHRDDDKYWNTIFKHHKRIENFYNAFFYYVFDVMGCSTNTFDDCPLINIRGY